MRIFGTVFLVTTLIATSALADAAKPAGPLVPGKPAGVKQAQMEGNSVMWGLGIAIVAGGAALVASGNGKSTITTTSTATSPR